MNFLLPTLRFSILLFFAVFGLAAPVQAQREYFNWYFGDSAGVSFAGAGQPTTVLLDGHVKFPQGAAAISDSTGRFQFSSDGYRVWDRTGRLMPGHNVSQVLRNFSSNARQVMAVPVPGRASRYYVFVSQREFYQNEYPVRSTTRMFLPYVTVDMSARNGLGGIVARDSVRIPDFALHIQAPIYGLACNWAAVRHPNGRDLWLVGVSNEGQYCSWLIIPTGLSPTPVVSNTPRWVSSSGIFKASPDGRTLALLVNSNLPMALRVFGRLELSEFNSVTGEVTNAQELPTRAKGSNWYSNGSSGGGTLARLTGLDFSPDGSRLYADTAGTAVLQYNLLAGSPQAIDASRTAIQTTTPGFGLFFRDMKLAPDGKIYLSDGSSQLARINNPNALGNACQLQLGALELRRAVNLGTFPLTPNDLNMRSAANAGPVSIPAASLCLGQELRLFSALGPGITAATYNWNFGDPASGPANTSTEPAPVHRFAQAGTYNVTLRITTPAGQQYEGSQRIQVFAIPAVNLGPDQVLCSDAIPRLSAGPQPVGSTFQWQDGSTGPDVVAATSGTYRVTVTSPSGCRTTDEVNITIGDCPALPNIITPNGDWLNQYFVLRGLQASAWRVQLFSRWGREVYRNDHYDNTWDAAGQPDGLYYYLLTNAATNQQLKGWLEVRR